jgi:hypothetical protein
MKVSRSTSARTLVKKEIAVFHKGKLYTDRDKLRDAYIDHFEKLAADEAEKAKKPPTVKRNVRMEDPLFSDEEMEDFQRWRDL